VHWVSWLALQYALTRWPAGHPYVHSTHELPDRYVRPSQQLVQVEASVHVAHSHGQESHCVSCSLVHAEAWNVPDGQLLQPSQVCVSSGEWPSHCAPFCTPAPQS
jgi:hypothetical protein